MSSSFWQIITINRETYRCYFSSSVQPTGWHLLSLQRYDNHIFKFILQIGNVVEKEKIIHVMEDTLQYSSDVFSNSLRKIKHFLPLDPRNIFKIYFKQSTWAYHAVRQLRVGTVLQHEWPPWEQRPDLTDSCVQVSHGAEHTAGTQ